MTSVDLRGSAQLLADGLLRLEEARAVVPENERCQPLVRRSLRSPLASTRFNMAEAWLTYTDQALTYTLPNEVDLLGDTLNDLRAWDEVLCDLQDENQLLWFIELALPRAVLALNLPFAIQNRLEWLIYALTLEADHVSNSDSLASEFDPSARLPRSNEVWRRVEQGDNVAALKEAVQKVWPVTSNRLTRVQRYRDEFVHRLMPFIGRGVVELGAMNRQGGGRWSYRMGQTQPLSVAEIANELRPHHQAAVTAYDAIAGFIEHQAQQIVEAMELLRPQRPLA